MVREQPRQDLPSLIAEFKARVREMNETAAEVSRGLGLPGEAQGTVLRSLYGSPDKDTLMLAAQDSDAYRTAGEAALQRRVYEIVHGFLGTYMVEEIPRFLALWEDLKQVPIASLASDLAAPIAAPQGLGFASETGTIISIVAATSWMAVRRETAGAVEQDTVLREAEAHGCSPMVARRLLLYILSETDIVS